MIVSSSHNPRIFRFSSEWDQPGINVYYVVGGTIEAEWSATMARRGDNREAYCRIVVEGSSPGRRLNSFGGTVWPGAWPHLFTPRESNGGRRSHHTITEAGCVLLDAAPVVELTAEQSLVLRLGADARGDCYNGRPSIHAPKLCVLRFDQVCAELYEIGLTTLANYPEPSTVGKEIKGRLVAAYNAQYD